MPEKGKKSNKQTIKQLPDRYPRTEEILIFSDMSELDHVFDSLDTAEKEIESLLYGSHDVIDQDLFHASKQAFNKSIAREPCDISKEDWHWYMNIWCVNGLTVQLRKACYEFEQYWAGNPQWKPEEDEQFITMMNDPDELRYLVTDLDSGRIRVVENRGERKSIQFYQPAYHAAARSLQLTMYLYQMIGDIDWVSSCINELKQTLTRYHAAALEIIMHRDNVYLHNNREGLETVRKIKARSKKRADGQKEEAAERRQEAIKIFDEFWKNKKDYETKKSIVEKVATEVSLSVPSIWRYLRIIKLSN